MKTISTAIPTLSFFFFFINPGKIQPTNYYLIKVIESLPFAENIFIYQVLRRNINIDSDSDRNPDLKSIECD